MSTVIYLANQQIQVVTGTPGNRKITVSQCYTIDAPEGCIINGMIMDSEVFISFMKDFWNGNHLPMKDVVLVINSSKFMGKSIEMPVLNAKKTLEFINREFTDIGREEASICGYFPIAQNGKKRKIYAEIISPEFIRDYVDIFQEIGIRIKAVYSGESSLIRLAGMTVAQQYKTFILQIADRMTITTILWVNGEFYYFNSTRCFHEQGTEDYAQDIARSVSQIRQFMQANQIEYPIEAVVFAGINPAHLPLYQNAISQLEIYARVEIFSDGNVHAENLDIQLFFHATSGLALSDGAGRQNFLEGYQSGRKKDKKDGSFGKALLLPAISLAVMLVVLAASITARTMKKRELQELKDYNESPATMMEVARYNALIGENSFLSGQYNAIDGLNQNLFTYPVCDKDVMKIIYDCAGDYATVIFDSFDADAGVISITTQSDTVDNINKFIKELSAVDIVNHVDYTGYSYEEDTGLWDIHVTFNLTESAGRQKEE